MSYFATLAARGTPTPAVSSSARSASPFTTLDQRLGLSSSLPSRVGGDIAADPFDAASASVAPSAPFGSVSFFTPAQVSAEPTLAASASSRSAQDVSFEAGYLSQSPTRPSLERTPLENALAVPVRGELAAPAPPRTRAESLHAELGSAVFEPRTTTSSPSAREVPPSRSEERAEPLVRGRATPASPGEQAPPAAPREPSFPAPLREALERVEAWMRRDAKPNAEPAARPERARHEPLERLRPASPERALRAAEGRTPPRELAAPRLSVGHIEVEVITAAPAAPAPVIWRAPPASAARSPLAAPSGRMSFGSRQG